MFNQSLPPSPNSSDLERDTDPQLPITAGRGEEVVRTLEKIQLGIPSTVGDRIGKTYVSRVTPALFIRAPINQFSRWTTSSDPASSLMATVARGGGMTTSGWKQSKNCEDNIWDGNNWTIKSVNTSAPIPTHVVFVGKGTTSVWFVFVYLRLPE